MMSGETRAASAANIVPVRPKPVAISSKTRTSPCRSATSRITARNGAGETCMPPAPALPHHRGARGRVDVHAAGPLQDGLDDDPGQLVGVLGGERLERLRPG